MVLFGGFCQEWKCLFESEWIDRFLVKFVKFAVWRFGIVSVLLYCSVIYCLDP